MNEHHPSTESLDGLLDGSLSNAERVAIERHFAACAACREGFEQLAAAREAMRNAEDAVDLPPGLEQRIRVALDREDAQSSGSSRLEARAGDREAGSAGSQSSLAGANPSRSPNHTRWLQGLLPLAAGVVLAAAGVALWVARPGSQEPASDAPQVEARPVPESADPIRSAFGELSQLQDAAVQAALSVASPGELEQTWRDADLGFAARVIDLSAMGIAVVGGGVRELAGGPAALALYQGPSGLIACWMFRAEDGELPAAVAEVDHRGFHFRVYRDGEQTLVVWREGETLCALAATGDAAAVVELAKAKAMA